MVFVIIKLKHNYILLECSSLIPSGNAAWHVAHKNGYCIIITFASEETDEWIISNYYGQFKSFLPIKMNAAVVRCIRIAKKFFYV